jgi:hypothetical protein
MSGLGQPGTEGHTVLGGSRLGGSGDFGIDRDGPLNYSHPIMVAPPVPPPCAEQRRTTLRRSPARPSRVGDMGGRRTNRASNGQSHCVVMLVTASGTFGWPPTVSLPNRAAAPILDRRLAAILAGLSATGLGSIALPISVVGVDGEDTALLPAAVLSPPPVVAPPVF